MAVDKVKNIFEKICNYCVHLLIKVYDNMSSRYRGSVAERSKALV